MSEIINDKEHATAQSSASDCSAAGVDETRSAPLNRQQWSCDKCLRNGAAWLEEGEGAWASVQKLADDHRRVSQNCDAALHELRVVFG